MNDGGENNNDEMDHGDDDADMMMAKMMLK